MDHPMLDYTLLDVSWFDALLLDSSFTVVVQLLSFNAKTFVLLLASFLLLRLLKGSAANRHLLLSFSLLAVLFLPIAHQWIPKVHIPIKVSEPVSIPVQITGFTTTLGEGTERASTNSVNPQTLFFALCHIFVLCYSFGVIFIWLRILSGNLLLWLVKVRARRVRETLWTEALKRHQRQLNISRTIEIRHTTTVISPMTWGAWRPVIFIPDNARHWHEQLISSTLLHELAHIRRYDWLVQQLARCACALYWINPLSWKALKKLYHYAETACDDIVLNTGLKSSHYASDLLHVARHVFCGHQIHHLQVAPSMATPQEPTQLKDRVTAILNPSIQHTPNTKLRFTVTLCLVLCLLLPLSSLKTRYVQNQVQTAGNSLPALTTDGINTLPEPIENDFIHLASDEEITALKLVKFELASMAPSLGIPAKQALQQIKSASTNLSPRPEEVTAARSDPAESVFNEPTKETFIKEDLIKEDLTKEAFIKETFSNQFPGGQGKKESAKKESAKKEPAKKEPAKKESMNNTAGSNVPVPAHELQLRDRARKTIVRDSTTFTRENIQYYTREKVVVPKYPRFALRRGIEGEVIVEFDIDSHGNVVDPRIIDASPSGVFDLSALKAIRKFIFNPKKINGKPVSVEGVLEKFVFVLKS